MSEKICSVCGRETWEYSGPARKPTNCMQDYDWCPDDNAAEHWRLGYLRLVKILREVEHRTAVGPPSPPNRPKDAASGWYDLLVRVNAYVRNQVAEPLP